jgi:hypothetical protein
VQKENLINKCIYQEESEEESFSVSPTDDVNFNENDMWFAIRRETSYNMEQDEKELWADFKNELH